ncbi:MAG: hypothetical protein FWD57_16900, partial [Polyangiaceae bacterium]|nr:hypothetical protein [Polyangiaceae bacterium]
MTRTTAAPHWTITGLFSIATIAIVATAISVAPPPNPKAPTASHPNSHDDPSPSTHATPIANYTLNVALNPTTHTINGTGTIRWHNRSAIDVSELFIHLYANAFRSNETRFLSDRRPGGR